MQQKLSSVISNFDHLVLERLNGPALVEKRKRFTAVRDITALGGDAFLIVGGLFACFLQAWLDGPIAAAKLLAFLAVGRALGWGLKALFKRPRPTDPVAGIETFTSSFPSIHTSNAFCVFAAMGLVASQGDTGLSFACGAIFAGLVGITRLVFRVHWPTDVIAGYTLGLFYGGLALNFLR